MNQQTNQTPASSPAARATEFKAVEGGQETTSGEQLVIEAYAALWLLPMILMFASWRRLSRFNTRIGELEAAIASSLARQSSKARTD